MFEKENYSHMEDNMDMNQGFGMNPYMGMINPYMAMYMQSMMHMYPWMTGMNYPMLEEDIMPNMAMYPYPMYTMPRSPMMMGVNTKPLMRDENMDENYMNYTINMNKYMAYMYEAEAHRLKAMEYMNKMEE